MPDATLALAVAAAHAAGAVLMRHFEEGFEVSTKSTPIDLVTTADGAAEAVILAALRQARPDDAILAEESGFSGAGEAAALPPPGRLQWVVDPLDGTTNFAHGFPHFSVSIALVDHEGPLVGVVHDPSRGETFAAVRGRGATLERPGRAPQPLAVTRKDALQQSLVATGFSYKRASTAEDNLAEFARIVPKLRCVRRAGSAALDLAYVAAGRLDGYWEFHLQPWDVAAGALLVREAGGQIVATTGDPWRLGRADLVAAGPELAPLLLDELRAARASRAAT